MSVEEHGADLDKTTGNYLFGTFLIGTLSLTVWDYSLRGGHFSTEIAGPVYALLIGMVLLGFTGLLVLAVRQP